LTSKNQPKSNRSNRSARIITRKVSFRRISLFHPYHLHCFRGSCVRIPDLDERTWKGRWSSSRALEGHTVYSRIYSTPGAQVFERPEERKASSNNPFPIHFPIQHFFHSILGGSRIACCCSNLLLSSNTGIPERRRKDATSGATNGRRRGRRNATKRTGETIAQNGQRATPSRTAGDGSRVSPIGERVGRCRPAKAHVAGGPERPVLQHFGRNDGRRGGKRRESTETSTADDVKETAALPGDGEDVSFHRLILFSFLLFSSLENGWNGESTNHSTVA
jgi:hypothetical protein